MTILKVLLVTMILLVIAFSGIFVKLMFSKSGSNKSGNDNPASNQGIGCGCGTASCCQTTS